MPATEIESLIQRKLDGPKLDRPPIEADNKKGRGRPRDAVQADLIATSNSNHNTH